MLLFGQVKQVRVLAFGENVAALRAGLGLPLWASGRPPRGDHRTPLGGDIQDDIGDFGAGGVHEQVCLTALRRLRRSKGGKEPSDGLGHPGDPLR